MFANKVCKQFEGAIILKHYPVLIPYSILIAQIENPITAPWQCSQLYNFTALCFLCGATWSKWVGISPWIIRQGLLSYLYSNNTSISLESAATYYQVCLFSTDVTNRIEQQFGMHLAALQGRGKEQILHPLVEEACRAAESLSSSSSHWALAWKCW